MLKETAKRVLEKGVPGVQKKDDVCSTLQKGCGEDRVLPQHGRVAR